MPRKIQARPNEFFLSHSSADRHFAVKLADTVRRNGVPVSLRDVRTDSKDEPHHARFHGLEVHDALASEEDPPVPGVRPFHGAFARLWFSSQMPSHGKSRRFQM